MTDRIKHTKVNLYDFFFANKIRKTYTNLGITLLLTIILVLFAIRPTLTTIQTIKDKTLDYQKQNTKALNKINAEKALQRQMNFSLNSVPSGFKEAIEFINKTFLKSTSFDTLYTNIYTRANKNNIVIRNISPATNINNNSATSFDKSPESPSDNYFDVNINFEAKSMGDIQSFLQTLEGSKNFPIFSRVKTVTINNLIELNKVEKILDSNKQQASIDFNVVFTIYTNDPEDQVSK